MLENLLRQYDNFGRPEQLLEIIKLTEQADGIPQSDFINFGIPKGAIEILTSISILTVIDGKLRLEKKLTEPEIPHLIIERIFKSLKQSNLLHQFLNHKNLLRDDSTSRISIQRGKIPLFFSSLRNLFVAFGFFVKNEMIRFEFYIHPEYQDWFLSYVIPDIESAELRHNPLKDLLEKRVKQEEAGKKAEKFVLAYEQKLRRRHPQVKNIRIISDMDTRAGYDIQSYSSDHALVLDKFIEVKSYFQNPRFYWSDNEVKTAKEKGADYFLYLIDRERMHEDTYQPIEIVNPATTIFNDRAWEVRDDGYFIRKVG